MIKIAGISVVDGINGSLTTVQSSSINGGGVTAVVLSVERPQAPGFSEAEGGRHTKVLSTVEPL